MWPTGPNALPIWPFPVFHWNKIERDSTRGLKRKQGQVRELKRRREKSLIIKTTGESGMQQCSRSRSDEMTNPSRTVSLKAQEKYLCTAGEKKGGVGRQEREVLPTFQTSEKQAGRLSQGDLPNRSG